MGVGFEHLSVNVRRRDRKYPPLSYAPERKLDKIFTEVEEARTNGGGGRRVKGQGLWGQNPYTREAEGTVKPRVRKNRCVGEERTKRERRRKREKGDSVAGEG